MRPDVITTGGLGQHKTGLWLFKGLSHNPGAPNSRDPSSTFYSFALNFI